jgi:pimeloyl-[acyl-carrier protein] methyl ester esterase
MKLHREQAGNGPDVVLIHGWGLDGGIWGDVAARLGRTLRVTAVDLPGHGKSDPMSFNLDALSQSLLDACPPQAAWVGWSLGALAVLDACRRAPERIACAVLVGATPRFVVADDWPHAVPQHVWASFGYDLANDLDGTMSRFLALQFGSTAAERAQLRALRAQLYKRGRPDMAALTDGLAILAQTDMRAGVADIDRPTLVVHGARDRLTPPAAGEFLARQIPRARYHAIPDAGHAPFISHLEPFMSVVEPFLHDELCAR